MGFFKRLLEDQKATKAYNAKIEVKLTEFDNLPEDERERLIAKEIDLHNELIEQRKRAEKFRQNTMIIDKARRRYAGIPVDSLSDLFGSHSNEPDSRSSN